MIKYIILQIFKAQTNHFEYIEAFLKPFEFTCVTLCARIRKLENNVFLITETSDILTANEIKGVFSLDSTLLHCIPNLNNEILSVLTDFLKDKNIKAISGQEKSSRLIIESLSDQIKPFQINNYKLMTLNSPAKPAPEELCCDDQIIRCTEDNIDILMDLQKQYLIKEVAPAGKQVTDLECKISLRQILKNQLMFALYADSELVAKANTNAIGWNYVQIGGVYTHPLFRRNYYAWHLIKLLCDRIQRTDKNVCLFVKEKNIPAIKLYEQVGFTQVESYTIAYY